MMKKVAYFFVTGVFPQHLQEKYMEKLTPDELELFKSDMSTQQYKIDKRKKKNT